MDVMVPLVTAAGALFALAATVLAAMMVVKSIHCFKKWTSGDNNGERACFDMATSGKQDEESVEEQKTSQGLAEKEQEISEELGETEQELHGELGKKEQDSPPP